MSEHERVVDDLRRSVAFLWGRCVLVLVVRVVIRDGSIVAFVVRVVIKDNVAHCHRGKALARRIRGRMLKHEKRPPCLRQVVLHDLVVRLEAGEEGRKDIVRGAVEEEGSMREPIAQPLVHLNSQRLPHIGMQASGSGVVVET